MIDINLLPGSTKRSPKRGLPRLRRGGGGGGNPLDKLRAINIDRTLLVVVGLAVAGVGGLAYLHFPSTARKIELEAEYQRAVDDSAATEMRMAQADRLMAQEAIISKKLTVIQEIDGSRYIWPHILDEISRALPNYVWTNAIADKGSAGALPGVTIEGFAGNLFAIGSFVEELEASPFLHQVRLLGSLQTQVDDRTVFSFSIEAVYQEPPPDVIQTVPIFGASGTPANGARQ